MEKWQWQSTPQLKSCWRYYSCQFTTQSYQCRWLRHLCKLPATPPCLVRISDFILLQAHPHGCTAIHFVACLARCPWERVAGSWDATSLVKTKALGKRLSLLGAAGKYWDSDTTSKRGTLKVNRWNSRNLHERLWDREMMGNVEATWSYYEHGTGLQTANPTAGDSACWTCWLFHVTICYRNFISREYLVLKY